MGRLRSVRKLRNHWDSLLMPQEAEAYRQNDQVVLFSNARIGHAQLCSIAAPGILDNAFDPSVIVGLHASCTFRDHRLIERFLHAMRATLELGSREHHQVWLADIVAPTPIRPIVLPARMATTVRLRYYGTRHLLDQFTELVTGHDWSMRLNVAMLIRSDIEDNDSDVLPSASGGE